MEKVFPSSELILLRSVSWHYASHLIYFLKSRRQAEKVRQLVLTHKSTTHFCRLQMELILYIDITLHCLFNKTLFVLSICLRVTEDSLSATVANARLLSTAVNTHSCNFAGLISFSTLTELLQ